MNVDGELTAIEARGEIRTVVTAWRRKFSESAEPLRGGLGAGTYFHSALGIWGHFRRRVRDDGSPRYWNAFGMARSNLRRNIIVEINPPPQFRYGNMQGVLARDGSGTRYLLHKGQLRIPNRHIAAEDFEAVTSYSRCVVRYSDDRAIECYAVANIDDAAAGLQQQMASFIGECERVRRYYGTDRQDSEGDNRAEEAERSSPELTGTYYVGPRDPTIIERRHGKVWHALADALDDIGCNHTNQRVAGWGPDLRTFNDDVPLLFEIKSRLTASELQCAVGQLFIYEKLLRMEHKKILVLPNELSATIGVAIRELGLEVLTYQEHGALIEIDMEKLEALTE